MAPNRLRRTFLATIGASVTTLSGCVTDPRTRPASGTSTRGTVTRSDPQSPWSDADTGGPTQVIVADSENGSRNGSGSAENPYRSLERAVNEAEAGDTVRANPGVYEGPIPVQDGGEPGAPLTITGPPDAVLTGDREHRGQPLLVRASHVHLTGLTVDGLLDPDAPDDPRSYARSPLVDVEPPSERDEYLRDIVVAPHGIGNASWALIVIRRAKNVEIGPFRVTGLAGANYVLDENASGKHAGEIVYLGTPPTTYSREDDYPWNDLDQTRNVHVHHIDNSDGHPHSELVNTKLGTRNVLIEYCTDGGGSQNAESYPTGSVRFQSYDATLRWCDLQNGSGHGVIIMKAGDKWLTETFEGRVADPFDLDRLGTGHTVYGNRIGGFQEAAIRLKWASPEKQTICRNDVRGAIIDHAGERYTQDGCPENLPEGDGIGHTGGNSPWT